MGYLGIQQTQDSIDPDAKATLRYVCKNLHEVRTTNVRQGKKGKTESMKQVVSNSAPLFLRLH